MKERPILFSGPMVEAILAGTKTQTRRVLRLPKWALGDASTAELEFDDDGTPLVICAATGCFASLPLPYAVNDTLWVKETWADVNLEGAPGIAYRASGDTADLMADESFLCRDGSFNYEDARLSFGKRGLRFCVWSGDLHSGADGSWRSSLHMPRWAARILLRVTNLRVERVRDISEADAQAEGFRLTAQEIASNEALMKREPLPHIKAIGGDAKYPLTGATKFHLYWEQLNGPRGFGREFNPWVIAVTFEVLATERAG